MAANPILPAALDYAARGWPTLPFQWWTGTGCSCGAGDCKSPAKHPLNHNGVDGATTDPGTIKKWWSRWPKANVGLATGFAFDVVDIDGPEGIAALNAYRAGRPVTWGPEAVTGRGHHLFHLPSGASNRVGMLGHVDFRGVGGYIVAPPSVHANGRTYSWTVAGPDEPLEPLPDWLRELVFPPVQAVPTTTPGKIRTLPSAYGRRALEAELGRVAMACEGERNHQLNRSAFALGQLVAAGVLPVEVVVSGLVDAAARAGLTGTEVEGTIASGLRKGLAKPRQVAG